MSELKAYTYDDMIDGDADTNIEYYPKSEADKVIADLEMKLARAQLVLRLNKPETLYSNLDTMSRLSHKIHIVERRERNHKHKRCLAMAKACCEGRDSILTRNALRWRWWDKWFNRWLELAEKFKEDV